MCPKTSYLAKLTWKILLLVGIPCPSSSKLPDPQKDKNVPKDGLAWVSRNTIVLTGICIGTGWSSAQICINLLRILLYCCLSLASYKRFPSLYFINPKSFQNVLIGLIWCVYFAIAFQALLWFRKRFCWELLQDPFKDFSIDFIRRLTMFPICFCCSHDLKLWFLDLLAKCS